MTNWLNCTRIQNYNHYCCNSDSVPFLFLCLFLFLFISLLLLSEISDLITYWLISLPRNTIQCTKLRRVAMDCRDWFNHHSWWRARFWMWVVMAAIHSEIHVGILLQQRSALLAVTGKIQEIFRSFIENPISPIGFDYFLLWDPMQSRTHEKPQRNGPRLC